MHSDAIERGQKVLIVDDLLATGGTARATVDLVRQLGGDVRRRRRSSSSSIELNGRDKLTGRERARGPPVLRDRDKLNEWVRRP